MAISCNRDSGTDAPPRSNPESVPGAIPWNGKVNYGVVNHGGRSYRTVKIGTQTWMAENLGLAVDSSWWYEGSTDSGARYGRLYKWAATMALPDSCNRVGCPDLIGESHRGICPSGWHLPSNAEWSILIDQIGGDSTACRKLKSQDGWSKEWSSMSPDPGNGTDGYGFRAVPAGFRSAADGFMGSVRTTLFWSSSERKSDSAYAAFLFSGNDILYRHGYDKDDAHSVRCLKDSP